jgi:hypothetical protein
MVPNSAITTTKLAAIPRILAAGTDALVRARFEECRRQVLAWLIAPP